MLVEEELEFRTNHNKNIFYERVEKFLEQLSKVKTEKDDEKSLVKEKLEESQFVGCI